MRIALQASPAGAPKGEGPGVFGTRLEKPPPPVPAKLANPPPEDAAEAKPPEAAPNPDPKGRALALPLGEGVVELNAVEPKAGAAPKGLPAEPKPYQ